MFIQEAEKTTKKKMVPEHAIFAGAGSLEEYSSYGLIRLVHAKRLSGILELRHGEKLKKLWLKDGQVFRIQSNLRSELFGQLAVERHLANKEQVEQCLAIQREIPREKQPSRLGDLLVRHAGISPLEIERLHRHQFICSLIQAINWKIGTFEFSNLELTPLHSVPMSTGEVIQSMEWLASVEESGFPHKLFSIVPLWMGQGGSVALAAHPVWSILGSYRQRKLSGVLTLRKGHSIFEVVIKEGLPMILYEGTFAKPRQTALVRQSSKEHEEFFRSQLLYLFSFMSGSAHVRSFEMPKATAQEVETVESTQVVPEQVLEDDDSISIATNSIKGWLNKVVRLFHFK